MRILLVAATPEELPQLNHPSIQLLSTGIGMVNTTYALTKYLSKNTIDLIINIGICGSFSKELSLGEVVEITNDQFYGLGFQDNHHLIKLENDPRFKSASCFTSEGEIITPASPFLTKLSLKQVKSITVQTAHGEDKAIALAISQTQAQVESMEGAAVCYVCHQENIPCIQLRSVSNYIEKRDLSRWNIPLAITQLHHITGKIVDSLSL
jgi:futalosine hydrolase